MTKQKKIYKFLFSMMFLGLASLLTLSSCYKDRLKIDKFSGGEWNPDLAIPLVYGEMDMGFIIEKSNEIWHEDADGLLSLIYKGNQITQINDKLISIDDKEENTTITVAIPPNLFPGDSTSKIFLIKPTFINNTNQRLDSILIKSGTITIEITSNINHYSYIEIIIPDLTKYGITFKEKVNIPASNTPHTNSKTISLSDYWLKLNTNGENNNNLEEYIKVMFRRGTGSNNSPYNITVNQNFKDIKYYQAFGYFHQYTVTFDKKEIEIDFFDNKSNFDATIEDANLKLTFKNSYGMPNTVNIIDFYVEKNGITKDIISTLLPTISLNYPDLSNIGEYNTTTLVFTKDNSNIVDIVNFAPHKLFFSGTSMTNPTGLDVPNFVIDTSRIMLYTELEIPLHGKAIIYTLQDTSAVDMENDYDWSKIVSMDLNIITDNYFPIESKLQIYLANSNYVIFDSLFTDQVQIINAAIPGPPPEYRVTSPSHNISTVTLSNSNLQNLKKTVNIIISASASTYDEGSKIIKIYNDSKLKFHLSAKAKYKTDY